MVLIITHYCPLRRELQEYLTHQGYEVIIPSHRHEVIPLVQESHPLVIVLDLYVADPNGLEIIEAIRRQGFTGKILVIAGTSVRNAVPEALRLGADRAIGDPQGSSAPLMSRQVEAVIRSFFHKDIQERAHKLYEERGRGPGLDWEDWFKAERQILKCRKRSPVRTCLAHVG